MSDLISRSELIKTLEEYKENDWNKKLCTMLPSVVDDCIDFIENMLTVYNVDKVVEELKKQAENTVLDFVSGGYVAIDKAIEIVKHGGVDKDCNNCANYTESDEIDNGCYLCCKGYEDNYEPKVDNGGVGKDVE